MGRRSSNAWRAAAVLALAGALATGAGRDPAAAQLGARVGQPAPEITGGPWLNSEPLSLAGLRGGWFSSSSGPTAESTART